MLRSGCDVLFLSEARKDVRYQQYQRIGDGDVDTGEDYGIEERYCTNRQLQSDKIPTMDHPSDGMRNMNSSKVTTDILPYQGEVG